MLVEINLLPEKQKRDITNIIIIIASALVLSGVLYLLYIQFQNVQEEATKLEQEIVETKLLSAEIEQQITEEMRNDYEDLVKTVSLLDNYYIPASSVLDHMVNILPERGHFYKYTYGNNGEINIQVIFDVLEDAASFTHSLDSTEFVKNVRISSIDGKSHSNPRYFQDSSYNFPSDILRKDTEHKYIPDRDLLDYQQFLGEDYMYGNHIPRYFVYFSIELDMDAVKKLRDDS